MSEVLARTKGTGEMMDKQEEITQERIKRFWEWCGFKCIEGDYHHGREWRYPNGEPCYVSWAGSFTDTPPIDLNSLFKHATDDITEINIMYSSNCVSIDIEHKNGNFYEGHANAESSKEAKEKTAEALFLALEKVMEEGK